MSNTQLIKVKLTEFHAGISLHQSGKSSDLIYSLEPGDILICKWFLSGWDQGVGGLVACNEYEIRGTYLFVKLDATLYSYGDYRSYVCAVRVIDIIKRENLKNYKHPDWVLQSQLVGYQDHLIPL
jgi:hypothetical protein